MSQCNDDPNKLRCPAEQDCCEEQPKCPTKNPTKDQQSCSHAKPKEITPTGKCPQGGSPLVSCFKGKQGQNLLLSACRKYIPPPPPRSVPYLKHFNPKRYKRITYLIPSTTIYGIATIVCTIWFCDWKAVLQYLPFYNLKFKQEEEENGTE